MHCIGERVVGHVTVLELASRSMIGELTHEITDKIKDLASQGQNAFVLNLARVSSLDSHGLGDLVGALEAALAAGGTLKLTHVHERVAYPLRVMNLERKFEAFTSDEDALNSFGTP